MNIGMAMEYSKEQLNYFRICYVVTDALTEGLRIIFKREWDNRYGATSGEWKDEPRNGVDFKNMESARNQKRHARLLTTMIGGNTAEWDCKRLFYAILYSDCIYRLSPVVRTNVEALRKIRIESAHISEASLSDLQFQDVIGRVDTAFQALGLSTMKIQEIKNQTSFPTEELKNVLKMVDDPKQELQVLVDQLNSDISPFCVLPPKPSHDVISRNKYLLATVLVKTVAPKYLSHLAQKIFTFFATSLVPVVMSGQAFMIIGHRMAYKYRRFVLTCN